MFRYRIHTCIYILVYMYMYSTLLFRDALCLLGDQTSSWPAIATSLQDCMDFRGGTIYCTEMHCQVLLIIQFTQMNQSCLCCHASINICVYMCDTLFHSIHIHVYEYMRMYIHISIAHCYSETLYMCSVCKYIIHIIMCI